MPSPIIPIQILVNPIKQTKIGTREQYFTQTQTPKSTETELISKDTAVPPPRTPDFSSPGGLILTILSVIAAAVIFGTKSKPPDNLQTLGTNRQRHPRRNSDGSPWQNKEKPPER